jgi:DNA replication protein DnaC
MTKLEILAALEEFNRPKPDFGSFRASQSSLAAAKGWDAANPERAAKRWSLLGQLAEIEKAEGDQERAEAIARHVLRNIKTSGAGEREVAAAQEPDMTWPGLAAAAAWWPTDKTWLVMAGSTGTGKSVASAWLILKTLENGGTAVFKRAADLAGLSQFDAGRDEIERLKRVTLLVVDDFGTENLTDHAGGLIYALFDARHSARKRTVLTSNLVGQSLSARFGERIADRIAQDGTAKELRGKSLRRVS